MQNINDIFRELVKTILTTGEHQPDRTGTGRIMGAPTFFTIDLADGFPLLTIKDTHFHSIRTELAWFLRGDTNIQFLKDNKVRIWDEWADAKGEVGKVYGYQWRTAFGVDQIQQLIENMQANKYSTRHIVTAWNPADLPEMALPPCHMMFQLMYRGGRMHMHVYMRSTDVFLGLPFNIASYALLLYHLCNAAYFVPGTLSFTLSMPHLYANHVEQAQEVISRTNCPELPTLLNLWEGSDYPIEDYHVENYRPLPKISAPISI